MSSLPEAGVGQKIFSAFNKIGEMVKGHQKSLENFQAQEAYGGGIKDDSHVEQVVEFFKEALEDMNIPSDEEVLGWELSMRFQGKGIVDGISLYALLRLLPEKDLKKIRYLNRFVGQEYFRTSPSDIIENEVNKLGETSNPYFGSFVRQVSGFCEALDMPSKVFEKLTWPKEKLYGPEREEFVRKLSEWRESFLQLPGIRVSNKFFSDDGGKNFEEIFNDFFHIQRQFDADNWKDVNKDGQANPQPLPQISAYRRSILEVNEEFMEAEGNIAMSYDYCRMKVESIVGFVRGAEDSFLKIVNRLDDEYPLEEDYGHILLHKRARSLKHMLFPLRCLFFEELEVERGVQNSNDNTLDSYLDMSLGNSYVSIPEAYEHKFKIDDLEPELKAVVRQMTKDDPSLKIYSDSETGLQDTSLIVGKIQDQELESNKHFHGVLDEISGDLEEKYKNDENNISRRLARLFYMFTGAMAQKETMRKASQDRLDNVEKLAQAYASRVEFSNGIDLEDESTYMDLEDDQLPLMASPQQLEDLYNTQKVVGRLAESSTEFNETAKDIEKGLASALEMLKKSEVFMEKLVTKMFPDKDDSRDLIDAIHKLVSLSYKTQQTLADSAKKESLRKNKKKKDDAKKDKDKEKEAQALAQLKGEVQETQKHLQKVLSSKGGMIKHMRITQGEKDSYKKQLRMITMMTINSMNSQKTMGEASA